jgi:hypothetical protein
MAKGKTPKPASWSRWISGYVATFQQFGQTWGWGVSLNFCLLKTLSANLRIGLYGCAHGRLDSNYNWNADFDTAYV